MQIFLTDVNLISEMTHMVSTEQKVQWKYLVQANRAYALPSMGSRESDPNVWYFGEGVKQLLLENLLTVVLVFIFLKILQIFIHPSRP